MTDPAVDHAELKDQVESINELFEDPSARFATIGQGTLEQLRREQQRDPEVVRSFLPQWNRMSLGPGGGEGLALGWYIVLGGPTKAGKSLLMMNLIGHAMRDGHDCLLFSLEMDWKSNATRLRGIVSGADMREIGWGDNYDHDVAVKADRKIERLPGSLHTNFEPIWRLDDIREAIRVHRKALGVTLVVVDYAQLAEPAGTRDQMVARMNEISNQLQDAAKRYNVVTVAVSQMSEKGAYGSRRFGYDANQMLVIDEESIEDRDRDMVRNMDLDLKLNRHGPAGSIPIQLDKTCLQIREVLPDEPSY